MDDKYIFTWISSNIAKTDSWFCRFIVQPKDIALRKLQNCEFFTCFWISDFLIWTAICLLESYHISFSNIIHSTIVLAFHLNRCAIFANSEGKPIVSFKRNKMLLPLYTMLISLRRRTVLKIQESIQILKLWYLIFFFIK